MAVPSDRSDDVLLADREASGLASGAPANADTKAAPESQFTRPVRILFADGNDEMRDYVKRQISGFYEVDLASDGEAALLTARTNPPDLLLADVMTPRLGGFGLLKEWRADSRLRHVPVILLSARAGEESRVEALTAGATDYLVKPFNARELLARVSICLEIASENRTSLEREHGLRISAEKSEARAREELAAEVTATNRLHELSIRPLLSTEFQPLLEDVLAAAVALQNADFGCIQLYNPATRSLQIVVQQGFKPEFLEYFRDCHDETTFSVRAIFQGKQVIVKDILLDEDFAAHRPVALAAGYRAVQSTPIFSSSGAPLGVVSIYFQKPRKPTVRELRFTDLYAHLAAEVMERHRSEEALRLSESRFRSMVQDLPAAVYTCDAEGYLTFFNEAAAVLWGRRPKLNSERWCGSLRVTRPNGTPVPLDRCPMAVVLSDGRRVSGEELIVERPDGSRRIVMVYPKPIRDSSGCVTGAVNMLLDITEYKTAQQALQESEDRFRQYFELGLIGMASTSPEKGILEVNDELCRILGYERGELLQQTWAELTYPDDLAADVAQFDRVLAGEIDGYTLDKRWIRKDGRIIDSIMAAKCLRRADGSVDYLVGLVQDITDRKRAEEQLRESEERFRVLVESIPHHVWSFRKDGTLGYWSRRFADYTALTEEQLRQGGWDCIHPDDVERVQETWRKAWTDNAPYELELRIRGRDGHYRRFVCRADPVPDTQGRFLEWFGTSTDIEERRQAQEELQHAKSELYRLTRLTSLGELAAGIAHEVNQPLGAIVNNANVSLQLVGVETAAAREELREVLSDIVNDANRASAIIARTRGLMKKVPPGKEPVQLADLVRNVLALAEREIAEHRITIRSEISNELPPISADRVQLQQVLFNLVMNGIEAMSATEISRRVLTIGGQGATLNDRTAVQITVCDLGCGFSTEDPETLFESFYTTKPHGLGMGLRISRSIVEAHGGKLWARVNGDAGATFVCFVVRGLVNKPDSIVFVVDDDPSFRRSVERLLRMAGRDVQVFASAEEFLQTSPCHKPACLVTDLRMPGLNGLDLQSELARDGCPIPVIFITGHGDVPASVRAMKAGATEFLTKPFCEQEFLDAVSEALKRDRERRDYGARLAELRQRYQSLTPRECEVMKLVVGGMLNKQVAARLKTAEKTIKFHRANVMCKMQARSLAELVRLAGALGL